MYSRPSRKRSSLNSDSVVTDGHVVVDEDRAGAEVIALAHHQPPWQDTDRTLENAHVDVHVEDLYILTLKKRRRIGDDRGVRGSKEFSHAPSRSGKPMPVSSQLTGP